MNRPMRIAGLGLSTLLWSVPLLAQDATAPGAELPATTRALMAEIEPWGPSDRSRDPAGDLIKLADLEARVEADGRVPAMERGLLSSAIGAAHFYARDYDKAADRYGAAAVLFEEAKAPPEEMAGLYNNQAAILASIGRYAEAEQSHLKALALRREMEGERGPMVASSLFGLGFVYFRQGRMEEAVELFRNAVGQQIEFVGPQDPQTIMRLASLGSVLASSGREAEALQVTRQAEALGREHLGDEHPTYAIALNNLGNALINNELMAEAVPVLRETLRVRQQTVGEKASGTAITLRNLATALKETGHPDEAEQLNAQAIEIYEATGEVETPNAVPYMYAEMAGFAADRGDWSAYSRLAETSLSLAAERLGDDNHDRAHLNLIHAMRLNQQGQAAAALRLAERWVPVMQAALIPRHKDRIWAELLLGRLRQQAGDDGWGIADEAIGRLVEKLGDLGATDNSLVREARTHRDAALLYLEMAVVAGDAERGFSALQLANISELSLGQQFASQDAEAADGSATAAHVALRETARRLEEVRTRYAKALEGADPAAAALATELAELEGRKATSEAALKQDFPEYVALRRPRPVTVAAVRGSLGEDDVLLAPVEGNGRNWLVSITRGRLETRELPADLASRAARLRRAVETASTDPFPFADGHSLFQALLPNGVKKNGRVLLYGGGSLATLPLSVLTTRAHTGGLRDAPWLVREASFQVVGNVALFGRPAAIAAKPRELVMIGVGGPDLPRASDEGVLLAGLFRSGHPAMDSIADLPPLPSAALELRQLADALPGDRDLLLIGADAAEENFKKADLANANLIAFATHGLVGGEVRNVWEPTLLLGTGAADSGEDGLLGASEIARLKLTADWVILSACNTSAGDGSGGPVFSGLAAAFSQAGAKALMLSHWQVRDDAAARLSVETVRGTARGLARAEALRRAQLSLMDERRVDQAAHPAVWAPFVIIEN